MKPRHLVPLLLTTLAAGGLALCAPLARTYATGSHVEWSRDRKLAGPFTRIDALVALPGGVLFAAAENGLWRYSGGTWEREPLIPGAGSLLRVGDDVLAGANDGVWRWSRGDWLHEHGSPGAVIAFATVKSQVWALVSRGAESQIYRRDRRGWHEEMSGPRDEGSPTIMLGNQGPSRGAAHGLLWRDGALLLGTDGGFWRLAALKDDWELLRGSAALNVRSLAPNQGGGAIAATSRGLWILEPGTTRWTLTTPRDGLPISDLTCATWDKRTGTWIGSEKGLMRWQDGAWSYFAGPRWLPDDRVRCLSVADDGTVWVGTEHGVARLGHERLTLEEKAARYQRDLEARDRRYGYVTVTQLRPVDDPRPPLQEISDNDGLWTAMYVGSQCFRYATTHSRAARDQARRSMQAVLRLESITGLPGFPARAISNENEPGHAERSHGEWHRSAVEPGWWWKGDTSSDEIDGHYFAFMLYYDLAANEAEKAQLQATCRRITDHIISHGYYLVDADGKPTRWGVWAPERLNGDPEWSNEHGLNSLEILSHLKVAAHVTGDPKYQRAYEELIRKHGYALNTLSVKQLPPEGEINHSDDELAFLAYYPLLRLERDPALLQVYRASFRKQWEAVRPEANPLWNFMYGGCTGQACDVEAGIQALREIPLDLVRWPVRNSVREDLKYDPEPDRFGRRQLLRPLPWTERPLHKWNGNPYEVDGGDGRTEEDQTMWLLPYWLGRYHRLIR